MAESHAVELTDLLTRVGGGSREAFAGLYDRFSLILYCASMSVVRDPARAETATEQAFLAIWKHATRFDPRQHDAIQWMLTITVVEVARQRRASVGSVIDPSTPVKPDWHAA